MDSDQITQALHSDNLTLTYFKGVYPVDKLPLTVKTYPSLFIANIDESGQPGTHWVLLWFDSSRKGYFFDSYGLPPHSYSYIFQDFLYKNSVHESIVSYNNTPLQSPFSAVCGHWCLYCAYFLVRNCTNFLNKFRGNGSLFCTDRFVSNDHYIEQIICSMFPTIGQTKQPTSQNHVHQRCRSHQESIKTDSKCSR